MESMTVYLNLKCNIDCEYCFVKKNNSFMDRPRLEKILRWFIGQDGPEKRVNFLGGEPLLSAGLLAGLKDFLRGINTAGKKIVIKDIPTNGILLDEAMLAGLNKEGIKLVFSLDGDQFEHNRFRINKRATFDRILGNIELYKKHNGMPGIKCTVHPEMAEGLDKRVAGLLNKGFRSIHILPVLGLPWSREQARSYRESIDRITRFYLNFLKAGSHNIQIHPLKKDMDRVLNGEVFDNRAGCGLGSEPVFMPDGKAYACTAVMHYTPELMEKFRIGHIDTGVDVRKMGSFLNYKVCQDVRTDCTRTVPGACCRKICLCVNTRTGEFFSPENIATMFEIDAATFLSLNEALAWNR